MTRMTLLDGSFWVSLSAPRGLNGAAKAEAGYPPYNVELLEGEPEALRITLAVAGFAPDHLEVSTENGELSIRGKQSEEQPRDFSIAASPRANSSEAFAWQAGLRSARRSFKTAFLSSSSPARAKRNG
jgi:HSP20 family molecular chaperone IbpA